MGVCRETQQRPLYIYISIYIYIYIYYPIKILMLLLLRKVESKIKNCIQSTLLKVGMEYWIRKEMLWNFQLAMPRNF